MDYAEVKNQVPIPKGTDFKCRCSAPGLDWHSCPYSADVHNDDSLMCNCCDNCQHECALDI